MYRQEENGYNTVSDYLQRASHHRIYCHSNYEHYHQQSPLPLPIDLECRRQMADWFKTIIRLCKYNSETTEIAWSCIDRFLSTPNSWEFLLDRTKFQLVSLAALYTAVKIHENQALDPQTMAKLSNDMYTKEDIEIMEFRLLSDLKWRVNPPTVISFVRSLMDFFPSEMLSASARERVIDLTKYQIDLMIGNYQLSLEKSSLVAFAALKNSLDAVESLSGSGCSAFLESLAFSILNANDMSKLDRIQKDLFESVSVQSTTESTRSMLLGRQKNDEKRKASISSRKFNISPTIVSAVNHLCDTLSSFDNWFE